MRRSLRVSGSVIVMSIVLAMNCNQPPSPGIGLSGLKLSQYYPIAGSNCGHIYNFDFKDNSGGIFDYYIGFKDNNGTLVYWSKKESRIADNTTHGIAAELWYIWGLNVGFYYAWLYRVPEDGSYRDKIIDSTGPVQVSVTNYDRQACENSCCTQVDWDYHFYAEYRGAYPSGVFGAGTQIERAYAKLCKPNVITSEQAFSIAYVNATKVGPLGRAHSQLGYGYIRNCGGGFASYSTVEITYIELFDGDPNNVPLIVYDDSFSSGSILDLEMRLDNVTGDWNYFVTGESPSRYGNLIWQGRHADTLHIGAETLNWEDDMLGTPSAHFAFSACRGFDALGQAFQVNFNYWDTAFVTTPSEWDLLTTAQDAFEVWDKNRL